MVAGDAERRWSRNRPRGGVALRRVTGGVRDTDALHARRAPCAARGVSLVLGRPTLGQSGPSFTRRLCRPRLEVCPSTHPVVLPELVDGRGRTTSSAIQSGLQLASGGVLTGHADFLNAWEPAALDALVADCLDRAVDCGIAPVRATIVEVATGD